MSGATLQEVADKLGYRSRQAAWKATTSLLERQEAAASDEWRAFHLSRLERLLLGQWHPAISGDSEASLSCLRILQQIGKVTGVAAPRARPEPLQAVTRLGCRRSGCRRTSGSDGTPLHLTHSLTKSSPDSPK